jgi:arabinose-5-phosphate isomerase
MQLSISSSTTSQKMYSDISLQLINVLSQEIDAIQLVTENFPKEAEELVKKIVSTKGKIVFFGSGKSGLVARKLVATFSSLGIPSIFLHPNDSLHGDIGVVQSHDLVIILSKSGSGIEFEYIFEFFKKQGNTSILICCSNGPLCAHANLAIVLPFKKEACPHNLAPTSSSTLMMAFGDAIAIVSSQKRQFSSNDFARFHPAGTLGKKLLLTVESFMYKKNALALLQPDDSFQTVLITITSKNLGVGIVVNQTKKTLGIITDGDLRRACNIGKEVFEKKAKDIMTSTVKAINKEMLAYDALKIMEKFNITSLIIEKSKKVIGLIHIHDIIKAGLKG